MDKSIFFVVKLCIVTFILATIVTISQPAIAQPSDPAPTQSMTQKYSARVAAVSNNCNLSKSRTLSGELFDDQLDQFDKYHEIKSRLQDKNAIFSSEAEKENLTKASEWHKAESAVVSKYSEILYKSCHPWGLHSVVLQEKKDCNKKEAQQALVKFFNLVKLYRQEFSRAKSLGSLSTISVKEAQLGYKMARELYKDALEYKPPPSIERKKFGDVDDGGETIELPDIGGPPTEGPECSDIFDEACLLTDPETGWETYMETCPDSGPLLGEWQNREYGGTILFKVQPDETVSVFIDVASERMTKHGYLSGMEIARGWESASENTGTWKLHLRNGQIFSAKMPGREPGATYGTAKWIDGGIIHINRDHPNVVNFPGQLEFRLSDHKDWVRASE